ncbi:MAG: flavin reductase [Rhodospirillales bacterium]|nr:flavin reductase [Rhodospirillales bacterium]
MSLDHRQKFIDAMSCVGSSVNVITTDGPAGRGGLTVTAMSSVSADGEAPVLLVCVHHLSRNINTILENGVFCVNVLNETQSNIADRFAGRSEEDRFSSDSWVPMKTGAPRLENPLVAFDCRISQSQRMETHHVLFGDVEDVFKGGIGLPLIYANRAYAKIQ